MPDTVPAVDATEAEAADILSHRRAAGEPLRAVIPWFNRGRSRTYLAVNEDGSAHLIARFVIGGRRRA